MPFFVCYNTLYMRISKKFDYSLIGITGFLFGLVFASFLWHQAADSFAESDQIIVKDSYYVTIFDNGEKTIIKTTPKTVSEVLNSLKIIINPNDRVEPSLDTVVDVDNFFVNIYRARPVIIREGFKERYVNTASRDARTMAKDAGITVCDGDDFVLVPNSHFLETGIAAVYEINRNGDCVATETVEIPFSERKIKDYNITPGATEVRQLGEVGRKEVVVKTTYKNNEEISREIISETVVKEPVERIIAVGVSEIERHPLTPSMGRNRYTVKREDGVIIERQETYYDLNMSKVMQNAMRWSGCNHSGHYSIRDDGAKVDDDGYVLVAAELSRYPRCSVVETSLGLGKVYDTGSFAETNPEQFDLATDWTNRNGS